MSSATKRTLLTGSGENEELVKLLLEKRRREDILARMKKDSFNKQWDFIEDPARLKAALTSRRSGKSMGAALYFTKVGLANPGVSMLYTGLTDDSALRIIWKDCFKPIAKHYGVKMKLNRGELAIWYENGSVVYILGIDNSPDEMAKAFGQKFKLAVVDEGAAYKQSTKALIYDVLFPAVLDYEGTICFIGMPNNNTKSFFYDVTTGNESGWKLHKWNALDNPYVADKMRAQIEFLTSKSPEIVNTPSFRNQYLGEWAIETSALVYKARPGEVDIIDKLPDGGEWHHVEGIDLGYDDPTAFVILAYRDYDPNLYVVEAWKKKGMDLTAVAERIRYYDRIYRIEKRIVDGAHKQAIMELKNRHNISLVAADKAGKSDFVQMVNDDFSQGRIKFLRGRAEPLREEMSTLIWDEKQLAKGNFVEPKRAHNHCCDGFLYGWRYCFNWVDRGVPKSPIHAAEQEVESFWEKECERGLAIREGSDHVFDAAFERMAGYDSYH